MGISQNLVKCRILALIRVHKAGQVGEDGLVDCLLAVDTGEDVKRLGLLVGVQSPRIIIERKERMPIEFPVIVLCRVIFLNIDFGLFSQIYVMVQGIVIKLLIFDLFLLGPDPISLVEDVHDFDGKLDNVLSDLAL